MTAVPTGAPPDARARATADAPTRAGETRGSRIYAVASGKGGVGKTWLSVTLAHAFARAGRRALLFDGDIGLANIDVQLGLMPSQDLGAVLSGRTTLRQATTPFPRGGFDVMAGLSGAGSLAALPPTRLLDLGRDLRAQAGEYDVTIVDLGAGLDRTVRRFSQLADECLVVTTAEPTALTDAYAYIKLTGMDRPDARFRVIVNMAASSAEGERTYATLLKACRTFLNLAPPLAGIIRRDPKVPDAIRHQMPLLTRHPMTDAARDVERVVERLSASDS